MDKVVIDGRGDSTLVVINHLNGNHDQRNIAHDEFGEKVLQWFLDAPKDVTMPLLAKVLRVTEGVLWEK